MSRCMEVIVKGGHFSWKNHDLIPFLLSTGQRQRHFEFRQWLHSGTTASHGPRQGSSADHRQQCLQRIFLHKSVLSGWHCPTNWILTCLPTAWNQTRYSFWPGDTKLHFLCCEFTTLHVFPLLPPVVISFLCEFQVTCSSSLLPLSCLFPPSCYENSTLESIERSLCFYKRLILHCQMHFFISAIKRHVIPMRKIHLMSFV